VAQEKAGPVAQETPLEYAKRLGSVFSYRSEAIDNITRSYTGVRYSPRKELTEETEINKLKESWKEVCHTLITRRLQARKWFLVKLVWHPK